MVSLTFCIIYRLGSGKCQKIFRINKKKFPTIVRNLFYYTSEQLSKEEFAFTAERFRFGTVVALEDQYIILDVQDGIYNTFA